MDQLAKQYVTFRVENNLFGVHVGEVQEIIRHQAMTPVPLAPEVVRGLINLRGQIITAIDMRTMLGYSATPPDAAPMNVVVNGAEETVSLLVDGIGDVIDVDHSSYEPTPDMIAPQIARLLTGVFKLESQLLLILNTAQCMSIGE